MLFEDDEYTGLHSKGVVAFALEIADELGMDEEQRRLLEFGALLHDIGKDDDAEGDPAQARAAG